MPGLLTTARRIARAERALGPISPAIADRSPWDWFADGCPCGLPAGECRHWSHRRPPTTGIR
jgi:hypothetical protein